MAETGMITDEQRRAYESALPIAEWAWRDAELHGSAVHPPPVVSAVAAALGINAEALWYHVEGKHGWEPHNDGYEAAVWRAAGCTEHERLTP